MREAIRRSAAARVTYVVAAGNSATDSACRRGRSPASPHVAGAAALAFVPPCAPPGEQG
ncbi:hypothetical protein [Saccharothrix saharensis]|uniref:hypothetical protein n=1 Tax=Saccharothrix saharensis TaxID=571190 RepID=UPI001478907F|nr:hypothetical protein [Saccharothrix saharensis]